MDYNRPPRYTWEEMQREAPEDVREAFQDMWEEEENRRLEWEEQLVSLIEIPREQWRIVRSST